MLTAVRIDPAPVPSTRRAWLLAAAAILLGATALRLLFNFRHALPPSTDGAYYPMQAVWLLTHGRLMYDDLPLIFWLDAGLTRVLQAATGRSLADAAVLASRLVDSLGQPWAAAFVLLLGHAWSGGRRAALLGCVAAATLAVASPPIFRMASDFQKNSLGLVWMAGCLWALHAALAGPRRPLRWGALLLLLVLSCLTHVGAFAVTLVMVGTGLAAAVLLRDPPLRTRTTLFMTLAAAAGLAVLLGLGWAIAPTRTGRLLAAPVALLTPPGPDRLPGIGLALVVWTGLAWAVRTRVLSAGSGAARAVALGAVAGQALLVFPLLPQDYASRLLLMSPVPAAVILTFLLTHRPASAAPPRSAKASAVAAALLLLPAPFVGQGPGLTPGEAGELRSFAAAIPNPDRTLVVAPHGLQYWAGLLLRTPVRLGEAPADARTRYDRVLLLRPDAERHSGPSLGRPGRRGGGGPGDGPGPGPAAERVLPPGSTLLRSSASFRLYETNRSGSQPAPAG